jgi:hypothetical protein
MLFSGRKTMNYSSKRLLELREHCEVPVYEFLHSKEMKQA